MTAALPNALSEFGRRRCILRCVCVHRLERELARRSQLKLVRTPFRTSIDGASAWAARMPSSLAFAGLLAMFQKSAQMRFSNSDVSP